MAIDPSSSYPGQVETPDVNYPYGGAKNETTPGVFDGTPFEKAMLNDIFGLQQVLLDKTDIVPSGNAETVLVSQYLEALYQLASESKNLVINGTGIIKQRADLTLVKDAYDFGPDRFEGMATGTLVSAGTLERTAAANVGVTGFAHKFNQVTLTGTGILFHRTRIGSEDAKNLKNLKAALSCKVYHNVGSAIDYTLTVRKADVEDDFSATTEISNDGGTSVASAGAGVTELKFEDITMGDCSNGIEIELKIECGAITLKDFEQTEYQIKRGKDATPFKAESRGAVLEACEDYYEKSYDIDVDPGTSTEIGQVLYEGHGGSDPVSTARLKRKRATPVITVYSTTGASGKIRQQTAGADVDANIIQQGETRFSVDATGSIPDGNNLGYQYTADSEFS